MEFLDLRVGGLLLAPIIVAVVEVAKRLGLNKKYAVWLNGGLSVVGYGLVVLTQLVPGAAEPTQYVVNALVIFLIGAGFYDRAQATTRYFKS